MYFKPIWAITAVVALAACQPAIRPTSDEIPALPMLDCTVAEFTSDAGDADFISGNLGKRFEISVSGQSLVTSVTSDVFDDSTTTFVVTDVSADRVFARRPNPTNSGLDLTLSVSLEPVNGQRQAVQTLTSSYEALDLPTTQNIWTLSCRDAA